MKYNVAAAVRAIIKACRPRPKPRELEFVRYEKGNQMLQAGQGWRLAREEDTNHVVGWVWLERDAPDPQQSLIAGSIEKSNARDAS
jgi:hypothetical protein